MSGRLRRPGSPWRILVHQWLGPQPDSSVRYGTAYHVTNHRPFGRPTSADDPDTELSKTVELAGTEFDELVVGHWIHLEQMDQRQWWMNVGGVTLWVTADRDGHPARLRCTAPATTTSRRPAAPTGAPGPARATTQTTRSHPVRDPHDLARALFGPDSEVLPGQWVVAFAVYDPQTGEFTSRGWAFHATPSATPAGPSEAAVPAAAARSGSGGQPDGQRRPPGRTAASTTPSTMPPKGPR